LSVGDGALDDAKEALESRVGGVTERLIHPALGGGDDDAGLGAQTVEGDDDLGAVAAADGVGEHVWDVASVSQVEGSLGDADVGLDADESDAGARRQGSS